MATVSRGRSGKTMGLAFIAASLLIYRSSENQIVLGRWSWPHFVLISSIMVLLLATLYKSWRSYFRDDDDAGLYKLAKYAAFDWGVFFWGFAKFLSAIDSPSSVGEITDLIFFGSHLPTAAILEWLSMVLFFVCLVFSLSRICQRSLPNFGLMIGSLLFVILLAEGFTRLKTIIDPDTTRFPSHSNELWKRRFVDLNKLGFRDQDHTDVSRENAKRLLLIGDSYAFGWGIEDSRDRLGELLVRKLSEDDTTKWELINASAGGTHTLEHIEFLKRTQNFKPDWVILLYVFNDIDYLCRITPKPLTRATSILGRLDPIWVMYGNSYLFQEIYARLLLINYNQGNPEPSDPYSNPSLMKAHLQDLSTFVTLARDTGARVRIVPFDIRVIHSRAMKHRYDRFVDLLNQNGLPVRSIANAFDGYDHSTLTVNRLDRHPNELANRLAAKAVYDLIVSEINSMD